MSQHDFIISDANGLPIRLDLQAALQALATVSSGATAPATPYANMLWLDTSVLPDGILRQRDQANAAWITIPGFPAKASSAEVIAGTDDSKYVTPKGIADRDAIAAKRVRNRIVNGAMQISQENGDVAVTLTGAFPADMWMLSFTGGAHSVQRVTSVTPRGSQKRLRWTVTTALAALATGSYMGFILRLEGYATADWAWGAAGAKQIVVRFGFRGPAGTYCLALKNGAINRVYLAAFTISAAQANADTEQTFVVPGDVTGVWAVDSASGFSLSVIMAAGTSLQGVAGWQAGNLLGTAAISNGMATVGLVYEIFDVGVYLDINSTGIVPLWEMPDEASEMLACQHYYCAHCFTTYNAYMNTTQGAYAPSFLPVEMRSAAPTLAGVIVVNVAFTVTLASASITARTFREGRTSNATNATAAFVTEWSASARL